MTEGFTCSIITPTESHQFKLTSFQKLSETRKDMKLHFFNRWPQSLDLNNKHSKGHNPTHPKMPKVVIRFNVSTLPDIWAGSLWSTNPAWRFCKAATQSCGLWCRYLDSSGLNRAMPNIPLLHLDYYIWFKTSTESYIILYIHMECHSLVDKEIPLDAIWGQFKPYLTSGCGCTVEPMWCGPVLGPARCSVQIMLRLD